MIGGYNELRADLQTYKLATVQGLWISENSMLNLKCCPEVNFKNCNEIFKFHKKVLHLKFFKLCSMYVHSGYQTTTLTL